MSKHEQADLILKLYELRREATMRQARDWYFREFQANSAEDYNNTMFGEHGGHLRMVVSYWDMAAALVNHGAIARDLFNDTNGEHVGVFAIIEPILEDVRKVQGPYVLTNLEKLIDSTPGGRERTAEMRERFKAGRARLAETNKKS